jgi:hypothetical protein
MDLAQAEARLPRWMLAVAGVGTLGILVSTHVRFGVGFAVGAGLAILSYLWLHQGVEALMSEGRIRPSAALLAKILIRYPLAFAVVYLFYKTRWLPFQAILAGLFVPLGGVLVESIALIRDGLKVQA